MVGKNINDIINIVVNEYSFINIDDKPKFFEYKRQDLIRFAKCKSNSFEGAIAILMAKEIIRLTDEVNELKKLILKNDKD